MLKGFQNLADGILPKDAGMYKNLMDLIFADGTGLPDIHKVNLFLSEILNITNPDLTNEQRRRDIAATMLYATMIAGHYREKHNHVSVVRVLVLLLSLISHLVDKYQLKDKYWLESYKIIWSDVIATTKFLETEINQGDFDSSFSSPFDNDLIPYRKHISALLVHSLKLSRFIAGNDEWKIVLDKDVAAKYKSTIAIWGEASLIPFLFLSLLFKNIQASKIAGINFAKTALQQILIHNGRKSKDNLGLISPYYDIDFAVKINFGMLEEKLEDNFKLGSYLIKPLLEMLVRAEQKSFIAENWKEISFMHFEEFVPDHPVDYYLWRIEKGENLSIIPKKEKSWKELIIEARGFDGSKLPSTMKRFPEFLPFFLSLFPHRVNSETIGFLDLITTQVSKYGAR